MIRHDETGVNVAGRRIAFPEFPLFLLAHLANVPATVETEDIARRVIAGDFLDADVPTFVRAVCNWGGYAGIAGRVLGRNEPRKLSEAFRAAVADIAAGVDIAVARLLSLHGLGVSFASKHLRFLSPQACAILDSKMAAVGGFEQSPAGLAEYSCLCRTLGARPFSTGFPAACFARERSDREAAAFRGAVLPN